MLTSTTVTPLRKVSPHFQRSINLTYDAGNADYIAGYIPTINGVKALEEVLNNTLADERPRAHVWHAPYGSGKSLLSIVLNALASRDPSCQAAITTIIGRIRRLDLEGADSIEKYWSSHQRLLPVILSGDEGTLSIALTRALMRSLVQAGLGNLRPNTNFTVAIQIIQRWEELFPSTYKHFSDYLAQEKITSTILQQRLADVDPEALAIFERLYPSLTAGAQFDGFANSSLPDAFHSTAKAIKQAGYDGLLIIWDEFGRFMDARAGEAFGVEASELQKLAEFCNRSGSAQVHLVLITHRQLMGYAADLPKEYQQEWARISERFLPHDVTSDPAILYRLIAESFETPNSLLWEAYRDKHNKKFEELTAQALELNLFDGIDDDVKLRKQVIEGTWPLHPLSVYTLPRISSQVAQNERTLFTFLANDTPETLSTIVSTSQEWSLIRLDVLWDYFSESIRLDTRPGGSHTIWSGVVYALSKVDESELLARQVIKCLGVLTIANDFSLRAGYGKVIPSTELLAWAIEQEFNVVNSLLETLARRRVVILRRADGYWTFTRGSDVDLDASVRIAIERNAPPTLQLRQLLERDVQPPFHFPRGYNLEKHMTRYFWGQYRWVGELTDLGSDGFLKQLGPSGYADGTIVYLLPTNSVECRDAQLAVNALPAGRAVYVIPDRPLLIKEPLLELFALQDLKHDVAFIEQDERLPREINFFIEDALRRLQRTLEPLVNPVFKGTAWWWHDGTQWRNEHVSSAVDCSRLLTRLCNIWFNQTPVLNNESINQQQPTGQQLKAAEKVIDALLTQTDTNSFSSDLGLSGYGPDLLILRTLLVKTGLLQTLDDSSEKWHIDRPQDSILGMVWDVVVQFLEDSLENERDVFELIDRLQMPPFGLRKGVLPVILAAIMYPRLRVLTIRHHRNTISPISGSTFTTLCEHPEEFTIELGPWDERRAALWDVLEEHCLGFLAPNEREQQPLSYLSLGLLRWLQAQPRFCRDTNRISINAQNLRNLIRKAHKDSARVLLYDLLDLLGQELSFQDIVSYRQDLSKQLSQLKGEIVTAYSALLHQLDRFAEEIFASNAPIRQRDGQAAIKYWLAELESKTGGDINAFRFSDIVVQRFVDVVKREDQDGRFWENLSYAIIGIQPSDWNDRSVESFERSLLETKDHLERELFEISSEEAFIELQIAIPEQGEQKYRFRPSDLSTHGQHILQNFKSTLEIAGRPLSPDERRQVVLALLNYVLDGDKNDVKHPRKRS